MMMLGQFQQVCRVSQFGAAFAILRILPRFARLEITNSARTKLIYTNTRWQLCVASVRASRKTTNRCHAHGYRTNTRQSRQSIARNSQTNTQKTRYDGEPLAGGAGGDSGPNEPVKTTRDAPRLCLKNKLCHQWQRERRESVAKMRTAPSDVCGVCCMSSGGPRSACAPCA